MADTTDIKKAFKPMNGTGFLFPPKFTLSEGQMKAGLESKGWLLLENGAKIELTAFKKEGKNGVFWSLQIDEPPENKKVSELEAKVAELESKLNPSEVKDEVPM